MILTSLPHVLQTLDYFKGSQQRIFSYLSQRIIAGIGDPSVISRILAHPDDNATSVTTALLPDAGLGLVSLGCLTVLLLNTCPCDTKT